MQTTAATVREFVGAIALCACACTPDFPAPIWKGEFLEYASTVKGEVCAGSWTVQDRYVATLAELLDITIEAPLNYAYISEAERQEYCFDPDLLGCYYENKAYSKYAVHFHELAHGVADLGGMRGPVAFQEGFAEVFGNGQYSDDERRPAEEVLRDFDHANGSYYTAGLFVRFLIERHGLGLMVDFMRQADEDAPWDEIRETFQGVFHESLEDALLAFDAYPTCAMWNNRVALVECDLQPLPWDGDTWQVSTLECADEDVMGPVPDGDIMLQWTTRGMIVDEDGDYLAAVDAGPAGESGVRITRCASCWDSVDALVRAGDSRTIHLTAGQYYVTFIRETQETEGLAFSFSDGEDRIHLVATSGFGALCP